MASSEKAVAVESGRSQASASNRRSTRAMLFSENRELRHRLRGWQAVAALAARVARGEPFSGVVNEAVRECAAGCESSMVAVLILASGGSRMEVVSSVGLKRKSLAPVPVSHKEPIEDTARSVVPGWKAPLAPGRKPPRRAGDERALYLPIAFQKIPLGVLCLERHPNVEPFAVAERELARAFADQIAAAAFLSGPTKLAINRERMERSMHFAHALKAKILPRHTPELPHYRVAARCFHAIVCGGDFYDYIALPGDRFAVVVGEGTGRGISAALNLAFIIPNLRGSLAAGMDIEEAVCTLNQGLIKRTQRSKMVSICLLELDYHRRRGRLVRMGSTGVHLLAAGKVQRLREGNGTPLGVLADCEIAARELDLPKGTSLLLCTDGINKCKDDHGHAFSGADLHTAIKACSGRCGAGNPLARALARSIADHNRADVLADDITLISVECTG